MEATNEGASTKTLAVFENVVTKERKRKRKKFKTHRLSDEESSPSESELVIDDDVKEEAPKRKKSAVRIRLKEEKLNIKCEWGNCSQTFTDLERLFQHLVHHAEDVDDMLVLKCKWSDCPNPDDIPSTEMLIRHVTYHGYLAKLVNIGENVLKRNNFPDCSLAKKYSIDIPATNYTCEWEGCDGLSFNTLYDFLSHIDCHIQGAPSGKEVDFSEIIPCLWSGCGGKYSTRYKLADHIRVHTKERVIACPKCMALFSSKTVFSDHRKRQLKSDMRSFQCSQCLKLFSVERLLSDHMRSHINQYKCTLCDMTSPKPSMLAKHYRYKHMNARPFSCHLCKSTFVCKSNLNTHLVTHQNKPFKCDQCEFGCKSEVGLRSHMNKIHGLERNQYECQVCKKFFKRGSYLTYHLIKLHKFHWPSGHSRFRYRQDSDGVHRLQTVRYESLEVTEQMLKSESMQSIKNPSSVTYSVSYESEGAGDYKLTVLQSGSKDEIDIGPVELSGDFENSADTDGRPIIITIEDVDESGNVIQKMEVDSSNIANFSAEQIDQQEVKTVLGSRDMPVFEEDYTKKE